MKTPVPGVMVPHITISSPARPIEDAPSDARDFELPLAGTAFDQPSPIPPENRVLLQVQSFVYQAIIESLQEAVLLMDDSGIIQMANPALTHVFGFTPEELVGQSIRTIIPAPESEGDRDNIQHCLESHASPAPGSGKESVGRHKDGHPFPVYCGVSAIDLPIATDRRFFATILRDITAQKEAENRDPLTSLLNRRALFERMQEDISRESRRERKEGTVGKLAILFVDMDKFKEINDRLGHPVGDKVLAEAARRIQNCFQRKGDRVGRLGGDEFIVELSINVTTNMEDELERLMSVLREPVIVEEQENTYTLDVSVSIGIAFFPEHGATAEDLVKNADRALYNAKADGRSRVQYFSQKVGPQPERRMQ